jgi:phospholipase/carboxylesterase
MNRTKIVLERINRDIILTPPNYKSVLIWMHGLGDSAEGFLDVFDHSSRPVPEDMKIILLTAPNAAVTVNGGMRMNSWYDIKSFERKDGDISQSDVESNSKRVIKVIEDETKVVGSNRIFIGGFSQGACMALYTGLSFEKELGGVIAMSGLLFPFTKIAEGKKKFPILITHGKWDPLLPEAFCSGTYQSIIRDGYNIIYKTYDIEHTIIMEELDEMKKFITNNLI